MQFSFSRFSYLVRLQVAANRRQYLLGIAALAGVLLAFMLFFMTKDEGLTYYNQQGLYPVGLFLSAGIFGSTFFKQFTVKNQRIQALMLPVSAAERLAVAVLFVLVIFPLIYTMLCFGGLWLMNYIDVNWLGHFNGLYYGNDHTMLAYAIIYFYLQALVLLGAVWFRKYTFVKTAVMVCIIAIGLIVFNDALGKKVMSTVPETTRKAVMQRLSPYSHDLEFNGTLPYANMTFTMRTYTTENKGEARVKVEHYGVELPAAAKVIVMLILVLAPFFLWFITLLKLREQQL